MEEEWACHSKIWKSGPVTAKYGRRVGLSQLNMEE